MSQSHHPAGNLIDRRFKPPKAGWNRFNPDHRDFELCLHVAI
jgi:hypothetical protein